MRLAALEGLVEPEAKRMAIGNTFVEVFNREAERLVLADPAAGLEVTFAGHQAAEEPAEPSLLGTTQRYRSMATNAGTAAPNRRGSQRRNQPGFDP